LHVTDADADADALAAG